MTTPRQHDAAPIVPLKDGSPPGWIVACLDCGFAHDAHGLSANDAVLSIAPSHEPDHRLVARPIDYTQGWERGGKPLQGIPPTTGAHPLYSGA